MPFKLLHVSNEGIFFSVPPFAQMSLLKSKKSFHSFSTCRRKQRAEICIRVIARYLPGHIRLDESLLCRRRSAISYSTN